jgi:hypothetical protein
MDVCEADVIIYDTNQLDRTRIISTGTFEIDTLPVRALVSTERTGWVVVMPNESASWNLGIPDV